MDLKNRIFLQVIDFPANPFHNPFDFILRIPSAIFASLIRPESFSDDMHLSSSRIFRFQDWVFFFR